MSFNHPKAGPNLVGAYQMSGIPFVTSSATGEVPCADTNNQSTPIKVAFPFVTRFLTIRNTGINELRVGFSPDGVIKLGERRGTVDADKTFGGDNFFLIPASGSSTTAVSSTPGSETIQTFEIRCKEVYFLSNHPKNAAPDAAARSTDFSLLAGLTPINATEFPLLTGSNGFSGVG